MRLKIEQLVIDLADVIKAFILVFINAIDAVIDVTTKLLSNDWVKLFTVYFILLMIICFF